MNKTRSPNADELLNEDEAAVYLRLSKKTLQNWRVSGRGPAFVKIGRCVRYRVDVLVAYISRHEMQSTTRSISPTGQRR